jgi:hypothetical protein
MEEGGEKSNVSNSVAIMYAQLLGQPQQMQSPDIVSCHWEGADQERRVLLTKEYSIATHQSNYRDMQAVNI